MVTTTGRLVGLDDVEQMFRRAAGQRPGLEICVCDMQPVWRDTAGLAMRYLETHRLDGVETSRRSVVILKRAGQDRKSTRELQSPCNLVCRLLLGKKKQ